MSKPVLSYFNISASRGDECRIALHVAGIDFIDNRLDRPGWAELKPTTPFGAVPTLEVPGKGVLGQSNAILSYIGREYGLQPTDSFELAQHESLMAYVEEGRHHVSPILFNIKEPTERQKARGELATVYLPGWAANVEKYLGAGPYIAGDKICIADIKLYMFVRWFASGGVDHVPATVFAPFEKLTRLYHAVAAHPRVAEWVARTAK